MTVVICNLSESGGHSHLDVRMIVSYALLIPVLSYSSRFEMGTIRPMASKQLQHPPFLMSTIYVAVSGILQFLDGFLTFQGSVRRDIPSRCVLAASTDGLRARYIEGSAPYTVTTL